MVRLVDLYTEKVDELNRGIMDLLELAGYQVEQGILVE